MIVKNFKGYIEGKDITKISAENLAYPSKNVIVIKNKISTRGGIVNDGNASTENNKVHSEFVWKDSIGGSRPLRCVGQKVQVKYRGVWYTIYESLSANVLRVFFATFVDANTSVIKKRLFFCDGSTALYQWNGGISEVTSYNAGAPAIVLTPKESLPKEGFDAGNVTPQNVRVFRLNASRVLLGTEDKTYVNDPTTNSITLSSALTTPTVAGDIVISTPIKFNDEISATYKIDAIYSYKNHIILAGYNSVEMFWAHIATYVLATGLDFVQPVPASRTALTAIYARLDGNFTAMIARKDVLWVSDADDWYKFSKSVEVNAYGLWVDTEKFETGERKGALPMACAKHKGDIIYVAQDKTVQKVTSVEILGTDEIRQISDDVEGLLQRLDLDDIRVYYIERAIYFILPAESTMLILDLIEGYYQPPQTFPIQCMSIIEGVKYGHHNAVDETYVLFSGRDDLGIPIEAKIAFGYQSMDKNFTYKQYTKFGVSCRITLDTTVSVQEFFEEDGAKTSTTFSFKGSEIKTYAIDDDVSWATHPYAERGWGGSDMESSELRRAMVFDKFDAVSFFDMKPVFTITGDSVEFHLLAWYADVVEAPRKVGNDLFISK